jgi:hypothetical protein
MSSRKNELRLVGKISGMKEIDLTCSAMILLRTFDGIGPAPDNRRMFERSICTQGYMVGDRDFTKGELLRSVLSYLRTLPNDPEPEFNELARNICGEIKKACVTVGERKLGKEGYRQEQARWVAHKLMEI